MNLSFSICGSILMLVCFDFSFNFFHDFLVFSSMLFNLHVYVALSFFPLVIDFYINTIAVGEVLDTISILNLLALFLWPNMSHILENVSYAFEKNVYSAAFGWNVLSINAKFIDLICCLSLMFPYWFSVWMIYLLIYC